MADLAVAAIIAADTALGTNDDDDGNDDDDVCGGACCDGVGSCDDLFDSLVNCQKG